uniref:Uncharacterized protein n=1 Tax=Panagrolaimus sp. JU765 TaxID=591449 RepID=A0AC34R6H7_9BILA
MGCCGICAKIILFFFAVGIIINQSIEIYMAIDSERTTNLWYNVFTVVFEIFVLCAIFLKKRWLYKVVIGVIVVELVLTVIMIILTATIMKDTYAGNDMIFSNAAYGFVCIACFANLALVICACKHDEANGEHMYER